MKNVLTPLAKSILLPLRLKAAALATDTATQKKNFGSSITTVKDLEETSLLIKVVKRVENEIKGQKRGSLGMLAATLGASLL